ncbi:MAG: acyl-CoA dehydrogenase family protein [Vicinamibacterales bacterium]
MILDPYPEDRDYQESVRAFAGEVVRPAAAAIDEEDRFPFAVIDRVRAEGLLGVTVPREWGGLGRNYLAYALAVEAIGEASATVAVIVAVNNSLVAEPLARFGSRAQKQRWLRRLAAGEWIGAFALSEAGAGTDAARIEAKAVSRGGGYLLNGEKTWVANAEAAKLGIVFARIPDEAWGGVTAFIVPFDSPGVQLGARTLSLGVRGLGCFDIAFDNVRVAPEQVLGEPGAGFGVARWALNGGRVAIAAQALGLAQAAVNEAVAYARQRHTFGKPIATYEAVQWMIADAATAIEASRVLTYRAATLRNVEAEATVAASMAKLHASETASQATNMAVQVFGAAGYRRGSTVERLFRDGRAVEIYQGTSEAQRLIISSAIIRA